MHRELPTLPGRGTPLDPPNRFLRLHIEREVGWEEDDHAAITEYFEDRPRRIITRNRSPDVGFETSVNPYRGCMHGCVYCYARPTHEYLGFSAGLDFERRVLVRTTAPELLRTDLAQASWTPQTIVMSGVTDPYQPAESRLRITRGCLEVLAEVKNPVSIVTKNRLVTRDVDLLAELAAVGAAAVTVSVTTLRRDLQKVMEPRTSTPAARLEAVAALAEAGVPVGVNVAPVIPGLTDEEIPAILEAAASAGASAAGYVLLRLPHGVSELFADWLSRHFPERSGKILNRLRDARGGRLNDPRFGTRMRGEGAFAEQLRHLFQVQSRRLGLDREREALSTRAFRKPSPPPTGTGQLELFEPSGGEP